MTRLDDKKKGVMVMVMQRLHEDDPTGHFLEKGGWKHLLFPVVAEEDEEWQLKYKDKAFFRKEKELLHPIHESTDVLIRLKKDMGSMNFGAQYMQNSVPVEGNIIKKIWFQYYSELPVTGYKEYVISIDTAMKDGANNDWSVCTVWVIHKKIYYLVDVVRKKMNFPDLQYTVKMLLNKYKPRYVLIEDKGSGTSLLQQFKVNRIYGLIPCKPIGSKVERLSSASIAFEQGKVFFPQKNLTWLDILTHELLAFPGCKHDDQVDSVSQLLNWALTKPSGEMIIAKLTGL